MSAAAFLVSLILATQAPPWAPAAPELSYLFELQESPELKVWIHASFSGSPTGETRVQVTEEWGGVQDGGEDLVEVLVRNEDGEELTFSRPTSHELEIRHEPGDRLTVSCAVVANELQTQDDHYAARRPILNEGLFRTVGHLALFRPSEFDETIVGTIDFEWRGFEAVGWEVVSSWGVGEKKRSIEASIEGINSALYLAGDIRRMTRDIEGYPLTVTVAGDLWAFTPDEFADLCTEIVRMERAFFQDFERDFYWISLVPTGSPQENGASIGGTGLSNCFSLSVTPNAGFREEDLGGWQLVRVLAHEMFHEWNGITIGRKQPEELLYWFSEGFTEFYTRRLLHRGGFLDLEGYVASVNETLELYMTNPRRGDLNETLLESFWTDANAQKLPYQRGDIAAMLLDSSIVRHSDGKQSLDDVMRELLRVAREEGRLMDFDFLFATFADYADEATLRRIRTYLERGGMIALRERDLSPCLRVVDAESYVFDVGFDLEESQAARTVVGVREDGPAHAAGLRHGMKLEGWSVRRNDTAREVVFQVERDDGKQEIRYLPRGDVIPVYRVVPETESASCESL